MSMTPFIKWAGGKKQLLSYIEEMMPSQYNRYYEPFIGGGALLLDVAPENAVINDMNPQLLNIYRQLKIDAEPIISYLNEWDSVSCNTEYYNEKRIEFNRHIEENILTAETAALFIWINKHCFNGLYRVNRKGLFNVPYNNKVKGSSAVPENLRAIGEYLRSNNVTILEGDFAQAVKDAQKGDFIYFDSPYVPISDTANFTAYARDGFSLEAHQRLATLAKELRDKGCFVMLSNNDVPLVHELYDSFNIRTVNVRRSVNRDATKRKGQEVIITGY